MPNVSFDKRRIWVFYNVLMVVTKALLASMINAAFRKYTALAFLIIFTHKSNQTIYFRKLSEV